MAQVKFGSRMIDITGTFDIDGQAVDASVFVGKLLGQIELLKAGSSTVPLGQGGTTPTSPSAVPPPSMPTPSSMSSSPSTSGASGKIECPECEDEVDPSYFCKKQNLCGDCIDTEDCDSCANAGSCSVVTHLNSQTAQNTSSVASALNAIANSGATVIQVGAPTPSGTIVHAPGTFPGATTGRMSSGTPVQPAKPANISGKPGDEFGW